MKYFSVIKDKDIFENPVAEPLEYRERPTAKGVVFDADRNMALLFAAGHALFPGGGVEKGETFEEAFIRECKEEIGCDIEIESVVGTALQYRGESFQKYVVTFFTSHIVGDKGRPTTIEEGELLCELKWLNKGEVHKILKEQIETIPKSDYAPQFNARTHLVAFEKWLNIDKE